MARVWYVAYGSNLDPTRFECYLSGGRPEGGLRVYPGCRDATAPRATMRTTIHGSLVFAGTSLTWGGGMAFLRRDAGRAMGRAYLLEAPQLADVVAQEVRQPPGSEVAVRVEEALPTMRDGEHVQVADGPYDVLVRLGSRRGVPAVSITRDRLADLDLRRPAPAYLWWIASGLRRSFGWDDERITTYLATAPGCAGAWPVETVAAIVSGATASAAVMVVADPR
jgi:hypothetical protein